MKYLGLYWDETLSFRQEIKAKCQTALFNFSRIESIRKYLTVETCETLASSLTLSHLDYSNIFSYNLPDYDMQRLQHVQNMTARLVLGREKFNSTTQFLITLHWLPVKSRITYKIALYVFKCLHKLVPSYLAELLIFTSVYEQLVWAYALQLLPRVFSWTLIFHSQNGKHLKTDRLLCPIVRNNLPAAIGNIHNLERFKHNLKTHLFLQAF